MNELKKKRFRSFLTSAIISWGICIIVSIFLFPALGKRFSEPIPFEEVDFSGDIDGLYVSGTIYGIYDWYCETTKSSIPVEREYLIDADDYYYMALLAPSSKTVKSADALMDASYAYMNGWDDGTKLTEAQFEVTGTINKLAFSSLKYYKEYLDWDNLDAEAQEMFLPYVLQINHYGHLETKHIVILSIVFILAFLFGLFSIFAIRSKNDVEKYIESSENPELTRNKIEEFLQTTPERNKLRYNSDFICDNTGDLFEETTRLVWAYKSVDKYNSTLVLGFVTGDTHNAYVGNDNIVNEHLYHLQQLCPYVIFDYSDDLSKLFKENREEFLDIRYNNYQAEAIVKE